MSRPIVGGLPQRSKVRTAEKIRAFLDILFGSKLVAQLRADLEESRRSADYFRGQFERMQLLVGHARQAPAPKEVRPQGATREGARRSWAQIQAANTAEQYGPREKVPEEPAKEN